MITIIIIIIIIIIIVIIIIIIITRSGLNREWTAGSGVGGELRENQNK